MRITESRLRRIIREVIQDEGITRRSFLKNIGGGIGAILASEVFSVHARPLKDRLEINNHVSEILKDLPFNQSLSILVRRAIESVEASQVVELKASVLVPWVEKYVKVAMNEPSNLKHGSLKYGVISRLGENLEIMLEDFKKSPPGPSQSSTGNKSGYSQGSQSSLTKDQMERYRAKQEIMQSALGKD